MCATASLLTRWRWAKRIAAAPHQWQQMIWCLLLRPMGYWHLHDPSRKRRWLRQTTSTVERTHPACGTRASCPQSLELQECAGKLPAVRTHDALRCGISHFAHFCGLFLRRAAENGSEAARE